MSDVKEQEIPDDPPASPEPAPAATEQASTEEAPIGPPKKKKKKRKKLDADTAGSDAPPVFERPALDADGRDRPRFLLRFPQDPELEALIQAFEAGNFHKLRQDAPRLVERTDRADVKRAAEELLRRIEPDPLVKFLLGVAVFLFVAIVTYVYYAHD